MARKPREIPIPVESPKYYLADMNLTTSLNNSTKWAEKSLKEYDFINNIGSAQMYISNVVIRPLDFFLVNKIEKVTVEDCRLAFNAFRQIITEINNYILYTPTKFTFCKFLNMSTKRFDTILAENSEMGELFNMINDSLSEDVMQNMLGNRIGPAQAIFLSKAVQGMRDNDPNNINIMNVNAQPKELSDILADFNKNGY